jgi:hypothetical protein
LNTYSNSCFGYVGLEAEYTEALNVCFAKVAIVIGGTEKDHGGRDANAAIKTKTIISK